MQMLFRCASAEITRACPFRARTAAVRLQVRLKPAGNFAEAKALANESPAMSRKRPTISAMKSAASDKRQIGNRCASRALSEDSEPAGWRLEPIESAYCYSRRGTLPAVKNGSQLDAQDN